MISHTSSSPLSLVLVMLLAALIPILLMGTTCMLKLSVVFLILRSALGAGQIPSAPIATLLSIVLTCHIMSPVVEEMIDISNTRPPSASIESSISAVSTPLLAFIEKHTGVREKEYFAVNAKQPTLLISRFAQLIPAFVISQLRDALLVGCAIFIPFLVIDLVVANILVGLGMMMVSPMQIALPLKLLLFTACDGWLLLTQSLVLSYQ